MDDNHVNDTSAHPDFAEIAYRRLVSYHRLPLPWQPKIPWYFRWWGFVLLAVGSLSGLVFLFILARTIGGH